MTALQSSALPNLCRRPACADQHIKTSLYTPWIHRKLHSTPDVEIRRAAAHRLWARRLATRRGRSIGFLWSIAGLLLWLGSSGRFGGMRSFDQAKKTIQIFCDQIQLLRGPCEGARDCHNKDALDCDHINFFCTFVDCAPEGP